MKQDGGAPRPDVKFQSDSWHTYTALTPAQLLLNLALGELPSKREWTSTRPEDTVR
jgi:hypothetical protein